MEMTTLDELEKLLKAGTPGPWWVQAAEGSPKDISHIWRAAPNPATYKGGQSKGWIATVLKSEYHGDVVSVAPNDAALIVAAVNALPGLIESARRVEAAKAISQQANCSMNAALAYLAERDHIEKVGLVFDDAENAHTDRATLLRLLDAAREELAGHGWQDISTAPKDGTHIQVRHDDGTIEDDVYWSDERYCILGRPQGSRGPGWVSTEAGNLPIDPPFKWRPTPHQTDRQHDRPG